MGYAYAASMIAVIVTRSTTYRMFGGFGIFFRALVISIIALLGGIISAGPRRPADKWLGLH
ncbi:MAG: hypothetical protein OEQ28_14255 [Acidobacteriota bacterium]|nr:hypothetical protein [Acidobacteriota bacterium]